MKKCSIAAVSFLNTVPLVDDLVARPIAGVDIRFGMPSRLAAQLESGAADVALIPVVELFKGRAPGFLSGTGIACRGAVDSVRLFHRGPWHRLERILTDRGSRSSVALLEVLLREAGAQLPRFEEVEPDPARLPADGEGILVIGDRCFAFDREIAGRPESGAASVDLGEAWFALTGLPFVFAVWAVSGQFLAAASAEDLQALARLLADSREAGLGRLDQLAAREAARGALGHKGEATAEAVAYYFRESLVYRLGDEEMKGLNRFRELCIRHGIVPEGPAPLILRG